MRRGSPSGGGMRPPQGFGGGDPRLRRHVSGQGGPGMGYPGGQNPNVRRRGDQRPLGPGAFPPGGRPGRGGPSPYNNRGVRRRHRSLPRSSKGPGGPPGGNIPDPFTNPNAGIPRAGGRRKFAAGPSPGSIRRINRGGPRSNRHIPGRVMNKYQSNNALRGTNARFGAGPGPQVTFNFKLIY